MSEFITYNSLKLNYSINGYGLAVKKKRNQLVEAGILKSIEENGQTLYELKSVKDYMKYIDELRENYYKFDDFFKKFFNRENRDHLRNRKFLNFARKMGIEVIILEIPITINEKYFIKKGIFEEFKREYITIKDAYDSLNRTGETHRFVRLLRNKSITIYEFLHYYDCMYVKREEFNQFLVMYQGISYKELSESLGINHKDTISRIIRENNIKNYRGKDSKVYITDFDFQKLKNKQDEIFNFLSNNYYTLGQIRKLFDSMLGHKEPKFLMAKIKQEYVPDIVRIKQFKRISKVYDKHTIDRYLAEKVKEREIANLQNHITDDYFQVFKKILNIENISFDNETPITENLWYKFIKNKLNSSEGTHDHRYQRAIQLKNITKFLITFLKGKEIYNVSTKELELILKSENVHVTYKAEINGFINAINPVLIRKGINPIYLNAKIKEQLRINNNSTISEIYSIEEYLKLLNYLSDYKMHLSKIIDLYKENKTFGEEYCFFWLYIILHANNCWRSEDVRRLPRLKSNLSYLTNISSIEDLEKIQLSEKNIIQIVKQYQNYWLVHNKNKNKMNFYCSDYLRDSFVRAVLCCEFISNNSGFENDKLINFYNKNKQPTSKIERVFFSELDINFKFKSRKMNKTVLTFTSSIQKQFSEIDPTVVAKHLRGHGNIETTNIYLNIPQEHFDFLTVQLFDKGYFGYVYDMLSQLMIKEGKLSYDLIDAKKISISIKALFGDIAHIEEIAESINFIYHRRKESDFELSKIDDIVKMSKLKSINYSLSPAKEPHYQCLFETCLAKKNECHKCPFAIPHLYALTTIFERINKNIMEYKNSLKEIDYTQGEKNRIFNNLESDFEHIYEAIRKFGPDIVKVFMDFTFESLKAELVALPEP